MEEEVVVAADVDEEEKLIQVFKFVNLLWLHGLIDGETLEAARKISSQYQGCHEHEVSCGGESDLIRHYKRCTKNPDHSHFIPVRDFKIEHLPPGYRDNLIFDLIRAEVDLTCRLLMKYTSANRPKYHPTRKHLLYPFSHFRDRNILRTGTGNVYSVERYTEEDNRNCQCYECVKPGTHTPKKVWGKVVIATAQHVVFDDDEARSTTCHFGYDTSRTRLDRCLKFTGLKFESTGSDVVGDGCEMAYVTHDMDIISKLDKMSRHRDDLFDKVFVKYCACDDKNPGQSGPCPIVIISHPHGYSKYITVGMSTHRETWSKTYNEKGEGWAADMMNTSYTYDTHTCPGSSGAPVIKLPKEGMWGLLLAHHSHSEGGAGNTNVNKCVVGREFVSPPTFP